MDAEFRKGFLLTEIRPLVLPFESMLFTFLDEIRGLFFSMVKKVRRNAVLRNQGDALGGKPPFR